MPDSDDEDDIPSWFGNRSRTNEIKKVIGATRRSGFLTLIKAGRVLQKAYRDQVYSEEDSPRSVMSNDRSERIAHLAESLAHSSQDDDDAVAELRAEAGKHRDDLRVAALYARQGGLHHESPLMNRAHRLLQAALTNTAVALPDVADRSRLELVAWFESLTDDEQWAELVTRDPRLSELEGDITSGRVVPFLPPIIRDQIRSGKRQSVSDESREAMKEWAVAYRVGTERLHTLVGPDAATDDDLLHTDAALESALNHLARIGL